MAVNPGDQGRKNMDARLAPCPFCGISEHVHLISEEESCAVLHYVYCAGCAHEGEGFTTKERAISWWNDRPTEDSLRREVEELKGLVRELLPHADEQAFTMIHRGEIGGMEAVALIRRAESALAEDTRGGGGDE